MMIYKYSCCPQNGIFLDQLQSSVLRPWKALQYYCTMHTFPDLLLFFADFCAFPFL